MLQPIFRAGETGDIARAAAAFLASDSSSFINGYDLVVDGGIITKLISWRNGLALRGELGSRIKAAAASL